MKFKRCIQGIFFLIVSLSYAGKIDSVRYLNPVFDSVTIATHSYVFKQKEELKLDIYQPYGDTLTNRPLVLLVHGGAFMMGARDRPLYIDYCTALAKRGYVAVSMSYRLTMKGKSFGCDQEAEVKLKAMLDAADDIWDATSFLIKEAKELNIDPKNISLVGSSAGAEAVLHAVFMNSNTFKYSTLVSYAGAMKDTSLITKKNVIPTLLIHGTCDDIVPFGSAIHRYCALTDKGALPLDGSRSIADRILHLGGNYEMVTAIGGGHIMATIGMEDFFDDTVRFLFANTVQKVKLYRSERSVYLPNGDCSFLKK